MFCAGAVFLVLVAPGLSVLPNGTQWVLSVTPSDTFYLVDDHEVNLNFTVTICSIFNDDLVIFARPKDKEILSVDSSSLSVTVDEIQCNNCSGCRISHLNGNLTLRGKQIGRTAINVMIEQRDYSSTSVIIEVAVHRQEKKKNLDSVFTIVLSVLLSIGTFLLSCELKWDVIVSILKKPIAPAIGMASQWLVMPLVAFGISNAVPNKVFGLGLFTIGCCPGGGTSNIYTMLFDFDLDLSMTMTTVSSLGAFATMPLWLYTLGRMFSSSSKDMIIPYLNLFGSLCLVAVPVIAGLAVKKFRPSITKKTALLVRPFNITMLLVVICFGIYVNIYMFEVLFLYWYLIPAAVGVPWLAGFFGYAIARLCRQSHSRAVTIAFETGIQNLSIALFILKFSLGNPDGDLASCMVGGAAIFAPIPLYVTIAVFLIRKRLKKATVAKEVRSENIVNNNDESEPFPIHRNDEVDREVGEETER